MATKRYITAYEMIRARFEHGRNALLSFKDGMPFNAWKTRFKQKILELIGPFPDSVPLDMEIIDERLIDDFKNEGLSPFLQQKIVYNTEPFGSCTAFLLTPGDMKRCEKRAAVLCAHGHGVGKAQMVGDCNTTWMPKNGSPPGLPNYEALAIHLVKEGYIVLAPDWRAFGERDLDAEYRRASRDGCNVLFMSFGYFGFTLLALNVWDAMRSIDLLQSLSNVHSDRIGMAGKSYGGTMTAYTTALDNRVKVACVSGYLSTLDDAMSRRGLGNYCGAQYLPGLLQWGDIPDILGLIAPRPMLIEAGKQDDCFTYSDTTKAYERLKTIYKASGHVDCLERDVDDVGHEFIFKKLPEFFKKNL